MVFKQLGQHFLPRRSQTNGFSPEILFSADEKRKGGGYRTELLLRIVFSEILFFAEKGKGKGGGYRTELLQTCGKGQSNI